jgi:anti-sigma factor RsiW
VSTLNDKEREELVAYLDGELEGKRAREVAARISLDPKVRAEAEALSRAWDLLEYLPKAEPSTGFTHRTLERLAVTHRAPRLAPAGRWRRWVMVLGWAAAVLLVAGLSFALASRLWPARPAAAEPVDVEAEMVRHLRVIQNQRLYELAEDLDFLLALDDPSLFGDEPGL